VETAKTDWLKPLGIIPALVTMGLLLYGLWQMSDFQKQERPWRTTLDRAKFLALVNLGLCPFLYWYNKMPQELFFIAAVFVLVLSAVIFLFDLNIVLKQLAAMLPEETLRHEMRLFTALNRWLIVGLLFLGIAYVVLTSTSQLPLELGMLSVWFNQISLWTLTLFALLPLAMTMALIWKTKEIILDSVFGVK
jgi:hypothetical protein